VDAVVQEEWPAMRYGQSSSAARDTAFQTLGIVARYQPQTAAQQALQQSQEEKPATTARPQIEQKAIEILKASSSRLAAARTMKFTAVAFYENPSRPGPPLIYATKSEVALKRPDKLRVITPGDGPASEFYYDGKTIMAYSPAENLVAITDAPPTIDAALEEAYHGAAIYFPFTDVIVADPYKDIADGLTLAFYIGQSQVVDGTTTDMVAYETHGAFVQIWIGAKDKLPRMARAIYRDDPAQLRHGVMFSNWKLNAAIPVNSFRSLKAKSANHIPFDRPDAIIPPSVNPKEEDKPAKTD
jgi:hypothetical protein